MSDMDQVSSTTTEALAPDVNNEEQKPMYNKIQVSDVVKRERAKAHEKGRQEALLEMELQKRGAEPQATAQQTSSLGGMPQLSPDEIRKMISEETPRLLQDHITKVKNAQIVDSFVQKMQAAEKRHPGLETKLNELDYSTIAPIVKIANELENTADIMKELVDNPMKMGNLVSLVYSQPKLAEKAMRELSNSITQNQTALAREANANDPLSSIKPSANAQMDNGDMQIKDYRKQSWLRG